MSDLAVYSSVVDNAMRAFSTDVSYAVSMVRQATTIQSKREVWAIRSELRDAEANARKLCGEAKTVGCRYKTPCGIGKCRFAEGDLVELKIPEEALVIGEPKPGGRSGFEIDVAVSSLRALRRIRDGR